MVKRLCVLFLLLLVFQPAHADVGVDKIVALARGLRTPQEASQLLNAYKALDEQDKFAELDAIQAALRDGSCDVAKRSCLQYFYAMLKARTNRMSVPEAIELRTKWLKARPDSVAAKVLVAETHLDNAQVARGNSPMLTMDLDQVRLMHERAEVAKKLLDEAARATGVDAQVFTSQVRLARYLEWPANKTAAAFDGAIAIDKRYTPAYEQMAIYLLPRWFGKAGDLGSFVRKSVTLRGDNIGCADIASITYPFERKQLYSFDGVSWSMVKAGLQEKLALLPADGPAYAEAMNCLAALACLADDKATAYDTFQRLGRLADPAYFKSIGSLKEWRDWAFK